MISSQILQTTIDGLKAIAKVDLCILDVEGKILVNTFQDMIDCSVAVRTFAKSQVDSQVVHGYQFLKIFEDDQLEYILLAQSYTEDVYTMAKIAAFQIQNLLIAYKERFDRENFMKNLILDNLLLVDIYNRAKKLKVKTEADRVVYMVEVAVEVVKEALFAVENPIWNKDVDFITAVDDKNSILVKYLDKGDEVVAEKEARIILSALKSAGHPGVRLAYGTVVTNVKEVSRSYKEAKMSLDIGRIFFEQRQVVAYSQLGIGRLIYQLPIPLCRMFIKEIFEDRSPDDFDEETLTTINKFFENSLNVSETSRQLYIHRNTLVYRLDKLQKNTGLDLRVFEDAITFKIALMVVKYMKHMEATQY